MQNLAAAENSHDQFNKLFVTPVERAKNQGRSQGGAIAPPPTARPKVKFYPITSKILRVLDTKCQIFSRLLRETSKNAYVT